MDLEQLLAALLRSGLPIVQVVMALPRVAPADAEVAAAFRVAEREAVKTKEEREAAKTAGGDLRRSQPQPGAGRPRRNIYIAAEIAYMADIEQRPLQDQREHAFGQHDYLGDHLALEPVSHERDSERSRTVRRWRNDGRAALAALGAWPWAVTPDGSGRLARTWWRDERYEKALTAWAHGEVGGAPEVRLEVRPKEPLQSGEATTGIEPV